MRQPATQLSRRVAGIEKLVNDLNDVVAYRIWRQHRGHG